MCPLPPPLACAPSAEDKLICRSWLCSGGVLIQRIQFITEFSLCHCGMGLMMMVVVAMMVMMMMMMNMMMITTTTTVMVALWSVKSVLQTVESKSGLEIISVVGLLYYKSRMCLLVSFELKIINGSAHV